MKKFLPVVLIALVFASCAHRSRVIPAATMSDIYADMFLADQWIAQNTRARKTADTSNFYAPILREYGYTVEDYDASVKHYLRKPDKYSKILKSAGAKLSKKAKRLEAIEDALQKRVKFSSYQPTKFRYDTLRFRDDTLGLWPNDSSFRDPAVDTLAVVDSVAAVADSVAVAVDSLAVPTIEENHSPSKETLAPALKLKEESSTNNQAYGKERASKEVLLLHGSDDPSDRGHSKLRKDPGGQGKPAR